MATKTNTKTVYVQSKPAVDEFGEIAKGIVIAIGCIAGGIVALTMIWQFIHWAATPDLTSINEKLSYIDQRVSNLNYPPTSTTVGTVNVPMGSACEYANGLIACHPQP